MTATVVAPSPAASPTTGDDTRSGPPPEPRHALRRLWRGPDRDPAWVRPALFALLAATALLYIWNLSASGWANGYYSAAVQAGSKSWKAFFFGSTDSSNFITVDKIPGSLWIMELSARVFGLNSWSILVPQALEGVAAVGILFTTIKRWFSPAAALFAGAALALTPVATLMFRFNNPDALLVLLLVGAAYALTRALESGRTSWLLLVGSLVGFGFLAKMLQALLVLPAFGLVYLFAGPPKLGRRIRQLLLAGAAFFVSATWWIVAVELTPAGSRPYIGGSQNNSVLNLMFGYNGFGRLTGNETGSVGGAGTTGSQWGPTGWNRLFNTEMGSQISWLLPAALIFLVAGLVYTWRRPRTDRTRAALILWGGWLVVTGITFSYGQGIIHPYYTVALAPAIAALVGIGAATFWRRRSTAAGSLVLAAAIGATTYWTYDLLQRTPAWNPWLTPVVVIGGLAAVAAVAVAFALPRVRSGLLHVVALATAVVMLAAPAAYSLSTAASPHSGAIPSAGPASLGGNGFGPRGGGAGFGGGARPAGGNGFGAAPGNAGGFGGGPAAGGATGPGRGFRGGGIGGLLNGATVNTALTKALDADSTKYRWVAATVGAANAASYQLAARQAVMAIGGFNGTDPAPTLTQFQQYVGAGEIHYFIAGGMGSSSGTAGQITTWVANHFTATTIGGLTVYDLTAPTSAVAS
ncbi:MAG: glycosyl transferase [Actinomycetia bacterium]|nr:glycosyl transferase [Actinomycetes bacterium]